MITGLELSLTGLESLFNVSGGGKKIQELTTDPGNPTSPLFPDLPDSPCTQTFTRHKTRLAAQALSSKTNGLRGPPLSLDPIQDAWK